MSNLVELEENLTIHKIGDFYNQMTGFLNQETSITLDASKLEQIDTAGIQALIVFRKRLSESGQELNIVNGDVVANAATKLGLADELAIELK